VLAVALRFSLQAEASWPGQGRPSWLRRQRLSSDSNLATLQLGATDLIVDLNGSLLAVDGINQNNRAYVDVARTRLVDTRI
jgi:hypothetical protein